MRSLSKIALLITTLFILNGCDAQTLNDINNALNQSGYGNAYTQPSSSYNSTPNAMTQKGFLSGERTSGWNKVCYYDTIYGTKTLNISHMSLCPLQY